MPDRAKQRADTTARGMVQRPVAAVQRCASGSSFRVGGMVHYDSGDGAGGRACAYSSADSPHL